MYLSDFFHGYSGTEVLWEGLEKTFKSFYSLVLFIYLLLVLILSFSVFKMAMKKIVMSVYMSVYKFWTTLWIAITVTYHATVDCHICVHISALPLLVSTWWLCELFEVGGAPPDLHGAASFLPN